MGSGKTRAGCEKIHYACENFPGARVLLLRQTRLSLTSTVLVTLEEHVMPTGHPAKAGALRENRYSYKYPNGSEIVLGGMDKPDKFMSGEYDLIYIVEMTDCREQDVEQVTTRLRNGKLPFQQLMGDCNPRQPNHWLKKRCDGGKTVLLNARLQDNPRYYDGSDWTSEGRAYLKTLESLSGIRRDRLVFGLWKAPEGARFEGAARTVQGFSMKEMFPEGLPAHWKKWLSGDYGKANPYCALWHARDEVGTIYTYQEDYTRGFEADQQAERIVAASALNESYEGHWLDKSMWSKEKSFGANAQLVPAATQYEEVFRRANKERDKRQFGPLVKGAPNVQEEGYVTLDSLLRAGKWRVAIECVNLWNEIEDAVHYQDPRTGIWSEMINPVPGRKDSVNHALDASVYGIHKRTPLTKAQTSDTINYEAVRLAQFAENRKQSEKRLKPSRPNYLRR